MLIQLQMISSSFDILSKRLLKLAGLWTIFISFVWVCLHEVKQHLTSVGCVFLVLDFPLSSVWHAPYSLQEDTLILILRWQNLRAQM
jgi:hypothetical protein